MIGQQNIGKQGLNPTGLSLPCSFHGFALKTCRYGCPSHYYAAGGRLRVGDVGLLIERCIGTSCILDVPKDDYAITNNKDATIDSSTRKMKSLHSAGRMRHNSSETDTEV